MPAGSQIPTSAGAFTLCLSLNSVAVSPRETIDFFLAHLVYAFYDYVMTNDYRSILTAELLKRVKENPSYSLRRFAQQLEVSPATLSGVLSGKRRLSLTSAAKITDKLNLPPSDAARFFQAVASHLANADVGSPPPPNYTTLSEDVFRTISDWYHYAILELTYVKGCQNDPRWFARKLGIETAQAAEAMDRLINLGLLEIKKDQIRKVEASITTPSGVPSKAVRSRHKQILQKAQESVETHSLDERDITSVTMAIDPTLLPEAKKRITAFRRELCDFLTTGNRRQIYELSIQLFPLSSGEDS